MVAPNAAANQKPVSRIPRMTLQSIQRGKQARPLRIIVHGVDGVGKSTLAAGAPNPIFIGSEDGTGHLDVARFPMASTFEDVLEAINTLATTPHDYQTLVLDTLDWMEPLVWKAVCASAKVESIEDVGGGFGKGYIAALETWKAIATALESLQAKRNIHVIILAHSSIKLFKNPEGEDFERYVIKMNDKAAAQWREWADGVYFANYETMAKKDARTKKVKGVSTGERYLYTQRTAAYDAKDRYGLPDKVALDWAEFEAAWKSGQPADPKALIAEIQRKAKEVGGEIEQTTAKLLVEFGLDATKLSQLNTRLNAKLAEQQAQQSETTPPAAA